MAISMDTYKETFNGTGVESNEPIKPEDEFFHAVYIGHSARKNHLGTIEEAGKFHIRGVQYNMDEVHMIITLTKKVLVKTKTVDKKDKIECFSFQEGSLPYKGISETVCGLNANERALNTFCAPCRAQIIVAGILCDSNGSPYKTPEGKPVFGFIRGKGMRYSGVSDHLSNLTKLELEPIVQPVTDESRDWEKKHINQSRVVSKLTRDVAQSQYGSSVNVFKFEVGPQLTNEAVEKILEITKKTVDKFKEKFDWSRSKAAAVAMAASTYSTGPTQAQTFGVPETKTTQMDTQPETNPISTGFTETEAPNINSIASDTQESENKKPVEGFGFEDMTFDDMDF